MWRVLAVFSGVLLLCGADPSIGTAAKDEFLISKDQFPKENEESTVPRLQQEQPELPPETVVHYYGYVYVPAEQIQEVTESNTEGIILPEYLKSESYAQEKNREKRETEEEKSYVALRNLRKTKDISDGKVRVKRTFCSVCGGGGGYYRPVYRPVYRPSYGGGGCCGGGGYGGGYGGYGGGGYGGYGGGCCGK